MERYEKDGTCRKCGSGHIKDEHLEEYKHGDNPRHENMTKAITGKLPREYPEQIGRTCNNCGYSWDTRPLDGVELPDMRGKFPGDANTEHADDPGGTKSICEMAKADAALDDLVADDVIEVGDTVGFEGLEGIVLMNYKGEYLIKLGDDWTTLSYVTLIRKAPKVHTFERVILQPSGYLNEERCFDVNLLIPMGPPENSDEWNQFQGTRTITLTEEKS